MLRELSALARATYRVLPKSTLCLGESTQVLDLFANTALQFRDLLWCAGNARNPPFEGGIFNLTGRHAILEFELLDSGKKVYGLGLVTNATFNPDLVNRTARLTKRAVITTHFGGSL